VTDRLDGIDLVIFDKDGTLIEFHAMWSGWAVALADDLERATGTAIRDPLFEMLGYDAATARAITGGRLAATPMARIREATGAVLREAGVQGEAAESALDASWRPPDAVGLARPVTDLTTLFAALRADDRRIAVATTDDREPTLRTLEALGLAGWVDAVVCADDGLPVKPAGDMVAHLCAELGMRPDRTVVVGDSGADLQMGRAAGVARCYGVLTGVGTRADLAPFADEVIDSVADLRIG
jgi:phosphoglycolate phosphatase-like HAD superfamily hydrolase